MRLHHPGLFSGYDYGVGSEGGRVEAVVNPFQEVAQGVFIDCEIYLLKRQRANGGLHGQRPVCDNGAVSSLVYNWKN